MDWRIIEEPIARLADHARVPISFLVDRRVEVGSIQPGADGPAWREVEVNRPFLKDYDAVEGNRPTEWAETWDVAHWGLISAFVDGNRVGGAVLAFDTAGLDMLEGRKDLAVLWDIRIDPRFRRLGLGQALFQASEDWARGRGCREVKVETQDINATACRLYSQRGCELRSIKRLAYPEFPDEIQLLWYKSL